MEETIEFEFNIDQNGWNLPLKYEELASDWQGEVNQEDRNVWVVDTSAQGVDNRSEEWNLVKFWPKQAHKWPREMYEGKDKEAKKMRLTQVQYEWVQAYLKTGNATQAIRDTTNHDWPEARQLGFNMKHNTRIMKYIQETAMECADIQYNEIIKNSKAPMAVRNDAIKDRLDRAGVWAKFEAPETGGNMFVGNMTITVEQ